ncbi:transcription factor MYB1R1-like [Solanum tuberosum]|uniref:MYBR domain class transcription factor n=1 Tax=Solanum tuberosum TaxID=4113 RepID=M1DQU8_SOLTU|nr:PREDICTED: transcription factor MYB1R1-like [Solanum tuberosum]
MKRNRWTEEKDKDVLVDESENSGDHSNKKDRWSVDEHKSFLMGLGKVGKGNWNQIAKRFVPSRSSTQVATHAAETFFGRHNRNKATLKRNILPSNESYANVNVSSSTNVNSNV